MKVCDAMEILRHLDPNEQIACVFYTAADLDETAKILKEDENIILTSADKQYIIQTVDQYIDGDGLKWSKVEEIIDYVCMAKKELEE